MPGRDRGWTINASPFTTTLTTLISACFARYRYLFGNSFEVVLAEDIIRFPRRPPWILGRRTPAHHARTDRRRRRPHHRSLVDFKGSSEDRHVTRHLRNDRAHSGVWGRHTAEPVAHIIIYVGATPAMLGTLMLVDLRLVRTCSPRHAGVGKTDLSCSGPRPGPRPAQVRLVAVVFVGPEGGGGTLMAVRLDQNLHVAYPEERMR